MKRCSLNHLEKLFDNYKMLFHFNCWPFKFGVTLTLFMTVTKYSFENLMINNVSRHSRSLNLYSVLQKCLLIVFLNTYTSVNNIWYLYWCFKLRYWLWNVQLSLLRDYVAFEDKTKLIIVNITIRKQPNNLTNFYKVNFWVWISWTKRLPGTSFT